MVAELRKTVHVRGGKFLGDIPCNSPSTAAMVVLGHSVKGWRTWVDAQGRSIDECRRSAGIAPRKRGS